MRKVVGGLLIAVAVLATVGELSESGKSDQPAMGVAIILIFAGLGALLAFGRRNPTATTKQKVLRGFGWTALALALVFGADGSDELHAGRTGDLAASVALVLIAGLGGLALLRAGRSAAPAPAPPEASITRPVPQRIIKPDDDFI